VSAGLRAANARLRELLAERDTRIGQMEAQVADLAARGEAELGELLEAAIIGRAGQARAKVAAEEDGT
jgi:hypothetical protein